jgi:uncharacterized peroxidase-related enzyme
LPHIDLPDGVPGIRSLFDYRPKTAEPLRALADTLLGSDDGLTRGERELIASYVSSLNECFYCHTSHGAFAAAQLDGGAELVEQVKRDPDGAPIDGELRALLAIAARVQAGGQEVRAEDVEAARAEGATDLEIHDTVLIAAAFCMFNRYVDGLATWQPREQEMYDAMAPRIVERGYLAPVEATERASWSS